MGPMILLLALAAADPPADRSKGPEPGRSKPAGEANKPDEGAEPARPRPVVDRSYRPSVGDRAMLYNEDEKGESFLVWAAAAESGYREYLKAEAMSDDKRFGDLEKSGRIVHLDDETPVLVLEITSILAPLNRDQFADDTAAAVRVLAGPHKGRVFLTPVEHVVRLRPAAAARAKARRPPAGAKKAPRSPAGPTAKAAPDPSSRAASMLRLGQGLEKSGKAAGALEFYRKVVREFPDTAQAKTAAARIEALGGR